MSEVSAYYAVLQVKEEDSQDFPTTSNPAAALKDAKKWLLSRAEKYWKSNPLGDDALPWVAGTITAVSADDGPADEPTASLQLVNRYGKREWDWIE